MNSYKHGDRKYGIRKSVTLNITEDINIQIQDIQSCSFEYGTCEKREYTQLALYQNNFYYENGFDKKELKQTHLKDHVGEYTCEIHLFGTTKQGESILVKVNYRPYYFIEVPTNWSKLHIREFLKLMKQMTGISHEYDSCITSKVVYKHKLNGWYSDEKEPTKRKLWRFLKLSFSSTQLRNYVKNILKKPRTVLGRKYFLKLHEDRVDPQQQFIDEFGIIPSGWIQVNCQGFIVNEYEFISHCQLEGTVQDMKFIKVLPDVSDIAPHVFASVDIECSGLDPSESECIQIGVSVWRYGQDDFERFVFILGNKVQPVEGHTFILCKSEIELLEKWRDFMIVDVDVDVITGYNINVFDFKFMGKRAVKYGNHSRFFYLSKYIYHKTPLEESSFSSSAHGDRKSYKFNTCGNLIMDLYTYIVRNFKFRSLKLKNVAVEFFGDQDEKKEKIDLPYQELFALYKEGTPEGLSTIAVYCARDCDLVLNIIKHTSMFVNLTEISRSSTTSLQDVEGRGQQIRIYNTILLFAHVNNFVVDYKSHDALTSYEGATVIPATPGFFATPISTLDFKSLYPSIIIAKNLCHTTLANNNDPNLKNILHDVHVASLYKKDNNDPYNVKKRTSFCETYTFIKHEKGILPQICEKFLQDRGAAKKLMKNTKDPIKKSLLNGKQLALKVICNSVYGFCGCTANGMLPCLGVAAVTTTYGRYLIETTKKLVLANFKDRNVQVIYGDTDSVMVDFKVAGNLDGVALAFKLGFEAGKYITSTFDSPIELEMESVEWPYLQYKKKRYVKKSFENPSLLSKYKLTGKGIETQRRDVCPFVKNIYQKLLNELFDSMNPVNCLRIFEDFLDSFVQCEIPFKDFIQSKKLKGQYANPESQIHWQVTQKMKKRCEGSEFKVGDRVQYVVCKPTYRKQPLAEKGDDPTYVQEKNIPLDMIHYLKRALKMPMDQFFKTISDSWEYKDGSETIYSAFLFMFQRSENKLLCLKSLDHNTRSIINRVLIIGPKSIIIDESKTLQSVIKKKRKKKTEEQEQMKKQRKALMKFFTKRS